MKDGRLRRFVAASRERNEFIASYRAMQARECRA